MQHIHVASVSERRFFISVILTIPHIIALSIAGVSYILNFEESSTRLGSRRVMKVESSTYNEPKQSSDSSEIFVPRLI